MTSKIVRASWDALDRVMPGDFDNDRGDMYLLGFEDGARALLELAREDSHDPEDSEPYWLEILEAYFAEGEK